LREDEQVEGRGDGSGTSLVSVILHFRSKAFHIGEPCSRYGNERRASTQTLAERGHIPRVRFGRCAVENPLERFQREHGDKLMRAMPTKFLRALLDAMEPTTAKNWLAAIRALAQHCIKRDLLDNDPTLGIKLRRMIGDGFATWTEEQIAQFESHHPIGSRERRALALGLYTAQRRGDVVMGRQHVRHVKQAKTGAALAIPIHPELATILDTVPATQQTARPVLNRGIGGGPLRCLKCHDS